MFTNLPYSCEYAKSGRARCKKCSNPIAVNSLRLSVLVQSYFSDDRLADKFHYHCFFSRAVPKGPDEIDGFEYLRFEDQRQILESIRKKSKNPTNKRKFDEIEEEDDEKLSKELKSQSNILFENLENLAKLPHKDFSELLILNSLKINDSGHDSYHLADALTFGLANPCPKCSSILLYKVGRYVCQGFSCSYSTNDPKRKPFNIPEDLKDQYEFLDNYQFDAKFKRISDPILGKCFQIRSNQVLEALTNPESSITTDSTSNIPVIYRIEPDPSCELRNVHILEEGNTLYNAVLTKVNIFENKNSFYRIQILEKDFTRTGKYYLFKVYGRIGTTIKGRRVEEYSNKEDAISAFEAAFNRQTSRDWVDRKAFSYSKGNNTYSYMDLDVKGKVGKFSKEQLEEAHFTLKLISEYGIVNLESVKEFVNLWNKFYTLYPESFETERPVIWATDSTVIKQKMEMIEYLMNL